MRNVVAAMALVLATGASAQTPPDPQSPPGAQPHDAGPGGFERADMPHPPGPPGFGGPGGPGRFGWRHPMPPPPPPSKAAHFRLRNGQTAIEVKCADDEPTKACVDAASQLIDKLASIPDRPAR